MVDRSSRWLEAIPLAGMDAATCADTFITTWIARFGVPGRLASDRGTQFTSSNICRQLGIAHSTTTAYHPQANRMVERSHQ
jgi:transposase InsO family protein